jgi:23S rRNA G2069 N7-methylase RlmK/C1962 C5-methylase RlmI
MSGTLDVRRDHPALVSKCLALLETGGSLYFSTNARRFRLAPAFLESLAEHGFAAANITERLRDEDFRAKRVPECWRFVREGNA